MSSGGRLFYNSLSPNSRSKSSSAKSHKLIEISKGRIAVAPEGGQLLRALDGKIPLNLTFVFGNARSGKSFLMNCLSGLSQLFNVMNTSEPVTKGVDISGFVQKHADIAANVEEVKKQWKNEGKEQELQKYLLGNLDPRQNGSSSSVSPSSASGDARTSPLLGYVDVEGQGAEDGTHDTLLAIPLLLIAKVVIFNHKGAPTVHDMLSRLGVLARAAEYVDLGEGDDDSKSSDDTPSLPPRVKRIGSSSRSGSFSSTRRKKFGHLHVVFRDFSFEGDESSVYDQLLGMEEKLKISGKKGPKSLGKEKNDPAERSEYDVNRAIEERNNIRTMLLENFQSIHIHLLKQPASADNLKQYKELPEHCIDLEFIHGIEKLKCLMSYQLKPPSVFASKSSSPLTGPSIFTLLAQITQALNEQGNISVPSVYRAMESDVISRVASECLSVFSSVLSEFKFPLASTSLTARIAVANKKMFEQFNSELADCMLKEEIEKKRQEMSDFVSKRKEDMLRENTVAQLTKLKTVMSAELARLKNDFDRWCENLLPVEDVKLIERRFDELKRFTQKSIADQLDDLKEVFGTNEYKALLLDFEEGAKEFFSLKSIHNENQLKDSQLRKLREELIRQQETLIQQNKKLEKYVVEEKGKTADMEEELKRLRKEKDDEEKKQKDMQKNIDQMNKELQQLRKKKFMCQIL